MVTPQLYRLKNTIFTSNISITFAANTEKAFFAMNNDNSNKLNTDHAQCMKDPLLLHPSSRFPQLLYSTK